MICWLYKRIAIIFLFTLIPIDICAPLFDRSLVLVIWIIIIKLMLLIMDMSQLGSILCSILSIFNLRSNNMNECFICLITWGNVNSAQKGKVTYIRCPIYYTTIPGTEFSSPCHQGAALSPKRDQQEYSLGPGEVNQNSELTEFPWDSLQTP